jgi:peptide chain release factor 1
MLKNTLYFGYTRNLSMLDKLVTIYNRFKEIEEALLDPNLISDIKKYTSLSKEHSSLGKIVHPYQEYRKVLDAMSYAKDVLNSEKDAELREMAKDELSLLNENKLALEVELKQLLIPKDPNDDKNAILEIRNGTGGDEAALFAGDLLRMYKRFAEKVGWKLNVVDFTEGPSGGVKEAICTVSGHGAYSTLKYESGVHRVQRVPDTETQGRVHTSAASVVVLPEVDDIQVNLDMNDIRKDTFCSSGPGGQSVNTTYSAIRLTHIPTGIVVSCQDEKSQLKNFDKALKVMRARVYELELRKHQESIGQERKSMVKTGDRSEKIRTYNFPQSRVTDHRIGYTSHNLAAVMDGEIDSIIEALRIADNAEKMLETG